MKANLGVLLKQAKMQGAIAILDSVLTVMNKREVTEVAQVLNTVAGLGLNICKDEEKLIREHQLNDYNYNEIEVELDDKFMVATCEEILKGYEEASDENIINMIMEAIKNNYETEEEE